LIIHCSGNAHKFENKNIEYTNSIHYKLNVLGTQNLLKGILVIPKYFLLISSVSVYGLTHGNQVDESYPLQAIDNYSKSKIDEEKTIIDWCNKNNILLTIFRLPLVYGENAPGNIAKIRLAIRWNLLFQIGSGTAKKSIVYINDVSSIILVAIQHGGIFNLTDRYHPSINEFNVFMIKKYPGSKLKIIPHKAAYLISHYFNFKPFNKLINPDTFSKLTNNLTFDDSKAVQKLNWQPHKIINL
jgi:nucleoside-diphosphate-sugar epimerase